MKIFQEVSEKQIAIRYLADNGLVAMERELAEKLASRSYEKRDLEIVYNPQDDLYQATRERRNG